VVCPDRIPTTWRASWLANRHSIETGARPFDQQFRIFKQERCEWDWVHVSVLAGPDPAGKHDPTSTAWCSISPEQKHAEEEGRPAGRIREALHETALGLVSRLDVDEVLEAILERALKLLGAAYGCCLLGDARRGELREGTPSELEVRVGTGPYHEYIGPALETGRRPGRAHLSVGAAVGCGRLPDLGGPFPPVRGQPLWPCAGGAAHLWG